MEGYTRMPKLIEQPMVITPAGSKPKRIEEYSGRVATGTDNVSVARMVSPSGWMEPGQRPEFTETTVVLKGMLKVEHDGGVIEVRAGQAISASLVNGFVTAHRRRMERSMLRSVCLRFHPTRCTVIRNDRHELILKPRSFIWFLA